MTYSRNLFGHNKITILMTLLLFYAYNVHGQIQLIDIKTSKCGQDGMCFKPIYKETWLNDSIIQIETTAGANCIGVYNPRIAKFGPLLFLLFDQSNEAGQVADCVCVFQIGRASCREIV